MMPLCSLDDCAIIFKTNLVTAEDEFSDAIIDVVPKSAALSYIGLLSIIEWSRNLAEMCKVKNWEICD